MLIYFFNVLFRLLVWETDHIASSLSLYLDIWVRISPNSIRLPTGAITSILHVQIVHLTPDISLSEVPVVPGFFSQLLIVSKLTFFLDCGMISSSTQCVFQDRSTRIAIGRGKAYAGLYVLELESESSSSNSAQIHQVNL